MSAAPHPIAPAGDAAGKITDQPASGAHPPEPRPLYEPKRQRVLELLALGCSVAAATRAVGLTRYAFYKWTKANDAYKAHAEKARGIHVADIDDALHEVDADARALVHRVIVDENVSAGIRLRAALAALNRKGPGWLPRELPPYEYCTQRATNEFVSRPVDDKPAAPYTPTASGPSDCFLAEHGNLAAEHPAPASADAVNTSPNVETVESVETERGADTAKSVESVETVETAPAGRVTAWPQTGASAANSDSFRKSATPVNRCPAVTSAQRIAS